MRVKILMLSVFAGILGLWGAGAMLGASAFGLDRAPPPKDFVQDGVSYHWRVAHGVTGSLSLDGLKTADGYDLSLVLSCSGLRSGGVQARFYEPKPNAAQLRVRTADTVFRVYRGINEFREHSFVEGHGDLPDGYLKSLATSPTVTVEYAGQSRTFPGPGKALAEHFGRYCSELSQRAARDE